MGNYKHQVNLLYRLRQSRSLNTIRDKLGVTVRVKMVKVIFHFQRWNGLHVLIGLKGLAVASAERAVRLTAGGN